MHEQVLVVHWRTVVLFSCESRQPILIDETVQVRLYLSHQAVHSQVELPVVYEIGLSTVLLDDLALILGDVLHASGDEDPLPLALVLWLHYYSQWCLPCGNVVVQVEELIGRDPGSWEEFEVFREGFLHQFQVLTQIMLQCYQVHRREMVYHLVWLHALELLS